MKITLWGTRGSFPTSRQYMLRYGGNTTCIEVRTDAGDIIILDAGTGIYPLGTHLKKMQTEGECAICFTHKHWDHIQGLTSFAPCYNPNWKINIYGAKSKEAPWEDSMKMLFDGVHFTLPWEDIQKHAQITEFEPGSSFNIGSALIETCPTCHPSPCVAYKITADGWTFFFSGDHEWYNNEHTEVHTNLEEFIKGSDVILADTHFRPDNYEEYKGWGHSTPDQWIDCALKTEVKRLIFTHHHPEATDSELEMSMDAIWRQRPDLPILLNLAKEKMRITLDGTDSHIDEESLNSNCEMCNFSRKVSRYADPGLILESVLTEARLIARADAGTVYLINEENKLIFSYAQNETLFPGSAANKMAYLSATVPIDKKSIAGYVADTATPLNIADVRHLPTNSPYSFNNSFDRATGYTTVSILAVPLIDCRNQVVGVLQLINSLETGKPCAFTMEMQNLMERLAITAADAIERSHLANVLIERMLETSSLRDPAETAEHVMRVGSMVAEIYHRWAEKKDIPFEELCITRDTMRLAAMLHDVGKVGIPDGVLKKTTKLTPEEFDIIKTHCSIGAGLFKNPTSKLDSMAHDIIQHHHQKWDGTGYTGDPNVPPLSGTDIPLAARITAVADVYDALVSKRCYKKAMSKSEALDVLKKDSGIHFDPEIIEACLEIKFIIQAIHERFSNKPEKESLI